MFVWNKSYVKAEVSIIKYLTEHAIVTNSNDMWKIWHHRSYERTFI
jgi:hypothetical protein